MYTSTNTIMCLIILPRSGYFDFRQEHLVKSPPYNMEFWLNSMGVETDKKLPILGLDWIETPNKIFTNQNPNVGDHFW